MPVAVASTVTSGQFATAATKMTSSDVARKARTTCPSPTFDARRLKNGKMNVLIIGCLATMYNRKLTYLLHKGEV